MQLIELLVAYQELDYAQLERDYPSYFSQISGLSFLSQSNFKGPISLSSLFQLAQGLDIFVNEAFFNNIQNMSQAIQSVRLLQQNLKIVSFLGITSPSFVKALVAAMVKTKRLNIQELNSNNMDYKTSL